MPGLTVQFIGLASGGIAVSIAVWFQMVSEKVCPVRYIFGFFILGSALILINAEGLGLLGRPGADFLEALVYIAILIGEIYVAHRLNKRLDGSDSDLLDFDLVRSRI